MSTDLTLCNALVDGRLRDLYVVDGLLSERGALGAMEIDVDGSPVVPGLHDHHIHLAATAAAADSVSLTPDDLAAAGGLGPALRAARGRQPDGWLRGIGYDLTHSGWVDRRDLDELAAGPVRLQDRTGSRWVLDSTGMDEVLGTLDPGEWPDGLERDAAGRPTGHLVRLDGWLRERLPARSPDWGALGRELAGLGVTSVTDAGYLNDTAALEMLAKAPLPQRIRAMTGDPATAPEPTGRVPLDAVKIVLDDDALPALDELTQLVASAHAAGRGVAVHCVTDVQLALALAAGLGPGDRIEHANVVPDGYAELVARAGVAVCVQAGLIAARGDRYVEEVDEGSRGELFPLRSLGGAGVLLLGGSDAPHGPTSPWSAVAAAVDRRTRAGSIVGAEETIPVGTAREMYQRSPLRGWPHRTLAAGEPADLLVLGQTAGLSHRPAPEIVATLIGGVVVHGTI